MACSPGDSAVQAPKTIAAISLAQKCRHGSTAPWGTSSSFLCHIIPMAPVQSKMLLPTLAMFRNRRVFLRSVAASLCLCFLLFWTFSPTSSSIFQPVSGTSTAVRSLPCHGLPGTRDTLFILRTGATEIADRLPAHISTSLRCFPNHIIFS